MKATGIVRKIDELGRIVIPKEIRHTLRITSGDSVEMYMESQRLILQKIQPLDSFLEAARSYCETIYNKIHCGCVICSGERAVYSTDSALTGRRIATKLTDIIKKGEPVLLRLDSVSGLFNGEDNYRRPSLEQYGPPIACCGEKHGAIIIYTLADKLLANEEKLFVNHAAELLCGQML